MSRQQHIGQGRFGADDHGNLRGGYSRGSGRIDQQWRGGTGGERSGYAGAMEGERRYGRGSDFAQGSEGGGDWGYGEGRGAYGGYGEDGGREYGRQRGGALESSGRYGNQSGNFGNRGNWGVSEWESNSDPYGHAGSRQEGERGNLDFGGRDYGSGNPFEQDMGGGNVQNYSASFSQSSGWDQSPFGANWQSRRGSLPKGYSRSDDRIKDDLVERLCSVGDLDLSEVSIEVKGGTVTLTGSVPERRMKHRIEDISEQCFGVSGIENQIRVERAESGEDAGRQGKGMNSARKSGSSTGAEAKH